MESNLNSWFSFNEADRQIPAPGFHLPSIDGKTLGPASFRPRANLVLVFLARIRNGRLISNLETLARYQAAFREWDGQILAAVAMEVEPLIDAVVALSLPFPVLADSLGIGRRIYRELIPGPDRGEGSDLVFVLDRYGAPYIAHPHAAIESPQFATEICDWLQFIELQCPE